MAKWKVVNNQCSNNPKKKVEKGRKRSTQLKEIK